MKTLAAMGRSLSLNERRAITVFYLATSLVHLYLHNYKASVFFCVVTLFLACNIKRPASREERN